MQWHYALSGQKLGPVSQDEIKNLALQGVIQPDTLLWTSGMPNWTPAGKVPELELTFGAPAPRPPAGAYGQPPPYAASARPGETVGSGGPLAASILTTLFCCLPFGIPAIVYAARISGKVASGDIQGAKDSARTSYIWSGIALGLGLICGSVYVAMAIPAFNRVRQQSRQIMLINDARQIGAASQQYFLSTGEKTVTFTYNPATGEVSGALSPWLTRIGKGYSITRLPIELENPSAFSISYPDAFKGLPVDFNDEGKTTRSPSE